MFELEESLGSALLLMHHENCNSDQDARNYFETSRRVDEPEADSVFSLTGMLH